MADVRDDTDQRPGRRAARRSRSASRARSRRAVGITAGGVVGLTVAQLFLQGGTPPWRTVFVEDGPVYFVGARAHGLGALTDSYAGYGQLLPRLLAVPAPHVAVGDIPLYFAVAGALATALCGAAVFWLARPLVPSVAMRVVLAVSPALLPVMVWQNLGNVTYTIWPIMYAGFWAILPEPGNTRRAAAAAVVAGLAAASNGLVLLFAPLVAYAVVTRRTQGQRIVLVGYSLGLLYQFVAMISGSGVGDRDPSRQLADLFVVRVVGTTVFGDHWTGSLYLDHGTGLFVITTLVMAAVVALLAVVARGEHRRAGLIAVAYAPVMFLVPIVLRGTTTIDGFGMQLSSDLFNRNGSRYASLAVLLLLSGIVILASAPTMHAWARTAIAGVVVVHLVVIVAFAVPVTNWRSDGTEWSRALRVAAETCETQGDEEVAVPIVPDSWVVPVPCSELVDR